MSKSRIKLDCCEEISLVKLTQSYTYSGILEGVPPNEWLIQRAVEESSKNGQHTHLIAPQETPTTPDVRHSAQMKSTIPKIKCLSIWETGFDPDDMSTDRLAIVWFQDDYAFPIDDNVIAEIKKIDWNAKAETISF